VSQEEVYYSDRPNLSSQTWWDFDPSIYDSVGYKSLLAVREDGQQYLTDNGLPDSTEFYHLVGDTVKLTEAGDQMARSLDKAAYGQKMHGQSVTGFENKARASYISAKMNIGDLALGFVSWEKEEGAGTTYTDRVASVIGTKWYPSHKYLYLSYNKPINQKVLFSTFINYRIHTIQNGSSVSHLYNYANRDLELKDLAAETPAYFATTYYFEQSKQFRSEFKVLYTQSENFYVIGGVELRNSELQGYYLTSATSMPQENGTYSDSLPGGNTFDVNDIGVYAQGQYRTKNKFGFTVGGRLDYNQIRQDEGLGYTFSPRVVVDKIYKDWVYKIIFSTGVENVSNYTKYNDVGTLVGNPDLKPESIYNYEISVSNKISSAFLADVDLYYSNVRNTVRTVNIDPTIRNGPRHNINLGDFNIWGIQSNVYYTSDKFQASVNYSYCYGVETTDSFTRARGYDQLKVADIATNKVNAIVNYIFLKHYNINFRGNYVSGKRSGTRNNCSS
jgi:outer membrane receptor for ferrienterochelin and colicin